jgi:ABC-type glycerol-3-phosphate transport system permease component
MSTTTIEQTRSNAVARRAKVTRFPKALNRGLLHFLLIVLVIVFLLPFIFLMVNSLKRRPVAPPSPVIAEQTREIRESMRRLVGGGGRK